MLWNHTGEAQKQFHLRILNLGTGYMWVVQYHALETVPAQKGMLLNEAVSC